MVVGWKSLHPCHRASRSLQPKREEERGDTFREEGLTKCFQRSLAIFSLKTWTVWSHPTTQSKQTQTLPLTAEGIRPGYKKPLRVTCFPWPRGSHSRTFHSPRSITTTDAGQDDWFARPNKKMPAPRTATVRPPRNRTIPTKRAPPGGLAKPKNPWKRKIPSMAVLDRSARPPKRTRRAPDRRRVDAITSREGLLHHQGRSLLAFSASPSPGGRRRASIPYRYYERGGHRQRPHDAPAKREILPEPSLRGGQPVSDSDPKSPENMSIDVLQSASSHVQRMVRVPVGATIAPLSREPERRLHRGPPEALSEKHPGPDLASRSHPPSERRGYLIRPGRLRPSGHVLHGLGRVPAGYDPRTDPVRVLANALLTDAELWWDEVIHCSFCGREVIRRDAPHGY